MYQSGGKTKYQKMPKQRAGYGPKWGCLSGGKHKKRGTYKHKRRYGN
jgi:hypothetical protein